VLSVIRRASAARRLHSATQLALDFLDTRHSLPALGTALCAKRRLRSKRRVSFPTEGKVPPLPVGKVRSGEFASTVASDSYSFKIGMGRTAIGHDLSVRRGIKVRTIFGRDEENEAEDRGGAEGTECAGGVAGTGDDGRFGPACRATPALQVHPNQIFMPGRTSFSMPVPLALRTFAPPLGHRRPGQTDTARPSMWASSNAVTHHLQAAAAGFRTPQQDGIVHPDR
jgi:hypothetical protein